MSEAPETIEREVMDVDVLFVGAGCASLAGAIRLMQLVKEHNADNPDNPIEEPQVAVIEKGQLQAMGSVEDIVRGITPHREIYMRTLSGADLAQRTLAEMPRIQSLRLDRNGVAFDFEGSQEELADLLATLIAKNLQVVEFAARETDLEDVFLKLTEGKVQ